jgi:ATP-dependent RNA helicase RhlE
VRRLQRYIKTTHQTLFFSATLPPQISALINDMLHDPVRVELAAKAAPVDTLTQTLYAVPQESKTDLLLELLKDNTIYSAIAFTRTKARANRLASALAKKNIPADLIHGDRSQSQRTRALDNFKKGKYRVLVATDIAARGIDIAELGHVINFDVPMVPEDYVHRVGRTARASATGDAITFVAADEEKYFAQIEKVLGKRLDRAKTPALPPVAPNPVRYTDDVPGAQRPRSPRPPRNAHAPAAAQSPSPRREFRSLPPSKSGRPR